MTPDPSSGNGIHTTPASSLARTYRYLQRRQTMASVGGSVQSVRPVDIYDRLEQVRRKLNRAEDLLRSETRQALKAGAAATMPVWLLTGWGLVVGQSFWDSVVAAVSRAGSPVALAPALALPVLFVGLCGVSVRLVKEGVDAFKHRQAYDREANELSAVLYETKRMIKDVDLGVPLGSVPSLWQGGRLSSHEIDEALAEIAGELIFRAHAVPGFAAGVAEYASRFLEKPVSGADVRSWDLAHPEVIDILLDASLTRRVDHLTPVDGGFGIGI